MNRFLPYILSTFVLVLGSNAFGQRYLEEVFSDDEILTDLNVPFATNINFLLSDFEGASTLVDLGTLSALADAGAPYPTHYFDPFNDSSDVKVSTVTMDIYYPDPEVDEVDERPVMFYLHTGNFLPPPINGSPNGTKVDSAAIYLCQEWAKRGYVAVSCDYRLGWNPLADDLQERRSTLLNAVYRAIHDAKMGVRYLRANANDTNDWGIDESRIVLYGQGSGGYVSQAYVTLDNGPVELFLPKFLPDELVTDVSYVDTLTVGTIDGWGFPNSLNLYRDNGVSAEVHMSINAGGALADESWLEAGDVPMCAINCVRDDFAPFTQGIVIVPTTQEDVVDVHGANFFIQKANDLGNNDSFKDIPDGDPFTDAARSRYGVTYDASLGGTETVNETPEGLFPVVRPLASFLFNEASPWEWWDPNSPLATAVVDEENGITAHMASLSSNPDMSPEKGRSYCDSINGYILPRVMCALELEGAVCSTPDNILESQLGEFSIYPNPTQNVFTIQAVKPADMISVYNVLGELVTRINQPLADRVVVDLSGSIDGVYLVTVQTEGKVSTRRVIKQ